MKNLGENLPQFGQLPWWMLRQYFFYLAAVSFNVARFCETVLSFIGISFLSYSAKRCILRDSFKRHTSLSQFWLKPIFSVSANIVYFKVRNGTFLRRRKRNLSWLAKRKEYRMLSDVERQHLHWAMNRLKSDTIDGVSKWDIITAKHYPSSAPGAHFGPAFLPWHRELLRQFEVQNSC